jgi:hypothetical protein
MSAIDRAIELIHTELPHYDGIKEDANIIEIVTKRTTEYPKSLFDTSNFYMQRVDNTYDVISYTLNKIYGDKSNNIQYNDINVEFITTEKVKKYDKKDDKKFITTRRYLHAVTMIITSGTVKIITNCRSNNENTWMFFQNNDNIFASSITINHDMSLVEVVDIMIKHIYGLFGLHDNDSKQEEIITEDKTVEATEQKSTIPDKNKELIPTNCMKIGDKIYNVNYLGINNKDQVYFILKPVQKDKNNTDVLPNNNNKLILPLRHPTLERSSANLQITPIPTEDTKNDIDDRSEPASDEPKTSNASSGKTKDNELGYDPNGYWS